MAVLGMRGSGSWSADERPKNYREAILYLYPNERAPLMGFLSKLQEESTDDPEFKVFLKGLPVQRAAVGGSGYNNSDDPVTITLAAGDENYFKAGHVIMNESTTEGMWVTAVNTTAHTLTCKRPHTKYAGTTAHFLLIIGTRYAEGAGCPTAIAYDPTVLANFTEIFRTSLNQTNTARQTHLRTGDQVKNAQRECLLLHNIEMEKAFLFGRAFEYLGGEQPERTTGGIFWSLTSNVKDYSAGLDIDTWENDLEDLFRYGSSSKLILGGARVINCVNKLARINGHIELRPADTTFGMNIQRYICPFGELNLKLHPLLSENPTFNSWAFVIDTAQIRYRFLKNRDTKFLPNRQSAGDDAQKDEYLTEAGLEMRHEKTHAVLKNMSSII